MAVVVKKTVECDVRGCHASKNLKQWTLTNEDGVRRKVLLCSSHRKPIDALWRVLEVPRSHRNLGHVYRDPSEIPRA